MILGVCFLYYRPRITKTPKDHLVLLSSVNSKNLQLIQPCDWISYKNIKILSICYDMSQQSIKNMFQTNL